MRRGCPQGAVLHMLCHGGCTVHLHATTHMRLSGVLIAAHRHACVDSGEAVRWSGFTTGTHDSCRLNTKERHVESAAQRPSAVWKKAVSARCASASDLDVASDACVMRVDACMRLGVGAVCESRQCTPIFGILLSKVVSDQCSVLIACLCRRQRLPLAWG